MTVFVCTRCEQERPRQFQRKIVLHMPGGTRTFRLCDGCLMAVVRVLDGGQVPKLRRDAVR